MEKKEIQEQRMRGYFIEATKDLLKGEGLKSVSVRSVAERAGYSFGTIYNYFRDINELVFLCVQDFQKECQAHVEGKCKRTPAGIETIRKTILAYVEYFVEYPGIFELFFLERMSGIGNKQPTAELIYTFLDRLCEKGWENVAEQGTYSTERIELARTQLRFVTAGMLVYYNNRRIPESYPEFIRILEAQIGFIFKALDE
jgi:AcrR family transcriptional regulator